MSAKAWRYLVAAGRDALERHADSEAAAYLQRAVELSEKRGEVPTPLLEELARARQRLSEYDAARALWIRAREALLAAGDHAGLARVERRLGMLPVLHAEMDQALVHFTLALSHARTAGRRDIEVSTLVSISLALANLGRVAEAKARAEEALAIVEASGDVVQRARVERALLELTTYTGPVNIAVEYSRRAVEHAIASGDRGLMWSAHWASAVLAGVTANAEEVVEQSRAAAAIARELNSPSLSAYVDEVAIEYAIAKGDWGEALRIAERAVPVARAVAPRTLAARLLVWMGTVLLYRDDVAAATAAFDEAWELSRADLPEGRGGEVHTVIVAHIGQASLYFATRDWRRALDYAQRGIELGDQHGLVAWSVHRLLPILAEGALYKNDLALAESAARRLGRDAATMGHRLGLWYAESVALYLEYLRAPSMAVLPSLLAIADAAEGVPYVFPAARLRRDVARLLVAQGDREGASREFRRAHEVFDRLGAQFELRWTREHMRQAGMRPPQLVNGARKVLSPRELEVALLVSRGRTNKEIGADLGIAWPTVQRHVSTAFRKLGVDSRMGLADAVRGMEGR